MVKTNAVRILEAAGADFEELVYDVADGLIDGKSIAKKLNRTEDEVFKTLVTTCAPREYLVFVVPSSGELDLKKAAKAAGKKSVEMIPLKELFPLTGYVHGGCSPVGMKKAFPTFIDETALIFDRICVSGGKTGVNIRIEPELLAANSGAVFADITKA